MKKWKLPGVFKIESAGQFFSKMTELNKSSKTFSQRELAKFLEWPVSYIPDLIKGRKPFTVTRSLELIRAFRIHPVDAEHLIFLAIASQSKADLTDIQDLRRIKSPKMRENLFPELTIFKFEAFLTCEAVALLGPNASRAKIERLLASKGMEAEMVGACLKLLLQKKLIKEAKNGFTCVVEKAYSNVNFSSEESRELQQAFLENAKNFFNDFFRPATGSSAFVVINKGRYDEVREKILTLKNWILEVSVVDHKAAPEDTVLFQFEQHLLPVFRPEELQAVRSMPS